MRALLLLLLLPVLAAAADWKAGTEQPLTTPSLPAVARVFLPEDWAPGRKWPVVFFYTWTAGKADIDMMREHTGGRDFIIVGVPPRDGGAFSYTPQSLQLEQKALAEMRDELAREVGLDPARVLVAGFSKGGWMSSLLLSHTPWLAGGCIMGGGWFEHHHEPPKKFSRPVYIYVGDGRLDGNYPPSLRATREFAALGARVTFDIWPGTGHALPEGGATGLRQWLALFARGVQTHDEALQWAEPELARIAALPDAVGRWYELRCFANLPYTRSLGEEFGKRVAAKIEETQRDPAVAAEAALAAELEAINTRETQDMKVTTLEAVGPRYEALAAKAPGSPAGRLAAHDAERIKTLWKTVK
jgi:predicted esterase